MNFVVLILVLLIFDDRKSCSLAMAKTEGNVAGSGNETMTLDTVRDSLIRQEDTIIFSLIERAKYPINSPTYQESNNASIPGFSGSFIRFFVKESEALQAKVIDFNLLLVKGIKKKLK